MLKALFFGIKSAAICTMALLFIFTVASETRAFVFWDTPNGSNDYFYWQNGGSDFGLFGSPLINSSNIFVFEPTNFEASDPGNQHVYDRLEFNLIAKPGRIITEIRITEDGDYSIYGNGQINVTGTLSVENLHNNNTATAFLDVTPIMPIASEGNGLWSGSTAITGLNYTQIKIVVHNDLFAYAEDGSAALVWKKTFGTPVAIQIIPEPATMAVLSIGSLVFIRRKK